MLNLLIYLWNKSDLYGTYNVQFPVQILRNYPLNYFVNTFCFVFHQYLTCLYFVKFCFSFIPITSFPVIHQPTNRIVIIMKRLNGSRIAMITRDIICEKVIQNIPPEFSHTHDENKSQNLVRQTK